MSEDARVAAYGKVIWETSRADEGTISATGANIVARAVMTVADAERNEAYARGYQAAREHWKARAESAERARDAALAEVAGLRDRLGRVEALAVEFDEVVGFRGVATALRAALAVPVMGGTEDASPAAEDAPPLVRKIEVPGERVEGFGFRLAPEQQRELDEQLEAIAESRRSAMRQAHDYVIGVDTGAASPTEGSEIPTPEASGAGSIERATEGGA